MDYHIALNNLAYIQIKVSFDLDFDFVLIRRDLVLETFSNKFSYLHDFIITSRYKFL